MSRKPKRTDSPILFIGDAWLKKIAEYFALVRPDETFNYLSIKDFLAKDADARTAVQKAARRVVITETAVPLDGVKADCHVPAFWIDGLSSLEHGVVQGTRVILGRDVLDDALVSYRGPEMLRASLRGDVDFRCPERFEASIASLKELEAREGVIAISDFLLGTYRKVPILNGVARPLPTVSAEMARRLAAALFDDASGFEAPTSFQLGHLAFVPSNSLLTPFDAKRLGLKYRTDPHWFPNLVATFVEIEKSLPEDKRRPDSEKTTARFVSTSNRPMTEAQVRFDVALKGEDHSEILTAARELQETRALMHPEDCRKADIALLRSAYELKLSTDAIDEVLTLREDDPDREVVRVLVNHCQSRATVEQLDRAIALAQQVYLPQLKIGKLQARKEFLIAKAEKARAAQDAASSEST